MVAKDFGKQHKDVLRKIDNLMIEMNSAQNCAQLFIENSYKDASGKSNKEYLMTRDGFSLLIMGFTGKEALQWKLKYIEAFNKMEEMIKNQLQPLILNMNRSSVKFIKSVKTQSGCYHIKMSVLSSVSR